MKFPSLRSYALAIVAVALPVFFGSLAFGAAPKPKSTAAPADAYFGKMKMSIVGMQTKVHDLTVRYHMRTISDTDIVHDAKLVESSLHAWQQQFPKDPLVLPTLFHVEQLYAVVQSSNARTHATAVLHFIATTYPTSHEAHLSRLRLAQGFPPLQAETAVTATPNPYAREAAAPTAAASGAPGVPAVAGSPAAAGRSAASGATSASPNSSAAPRTAGAPTAPSVTAAPATPGSPKVTPSPAPPASPAAK